MGQAAEPSGQVLPRVTRAAISTVTRLLPMPGIPDKQRQLARRNDARPKPPKRDGLHFRHVAHNQAIDSGPRLPAIRRTLLPVDLDFHDGKFLVSPVRRVKLLKLRKRTCAHAPPFAPALPCFDDIDPSAMVGTHGRLTRIQAQTVKKQLASRASEKVASSTCNTFGSWARASRAKRLPPSRQLVFPCDPPYARR